MSESDQLIQVFDNRAKRRADRRQLFRMALGAAAVGVGAFAYTDAALAQSGPSEADVLNFALNLEYLEANFYYYAAFGTPIPATDITAGSSSNTASATVPADQARAMAGGPLLNAGARKVDFKDASVAAYAKEIAQDEYAHVKFLRSALSNSAVGQPVLDVGITPTGAFSSAARAAGLLGTGAAAASASFDAYANDLNFLYAAFIFEDVGVTAYKGSAGALINNKTYVDAAAGILAAEAYHAAIVRTSLDQMGGNPGVMTGTVRSDTELVSTARDSLDGGSDLDQGINQLNVTTGPVTGLTSNIVPTDGDGLAFSRTAQQVLNVVYLNKNAVSMGGFFPVGVNGNVKTSAQN